MTAEAFEARLFQLKTWLEQLGACNLCALDMAFAQVEREGGNHKSRAYPSRTCRKGDAGACFKVGRDAWKNLPAPEQGAAA